MSTRSNTAAALASLGVLVAGWTIGTGNGQALAQTVATGTATPGSTGTASAGTTTSSAATASASNSTSAASTASTGSTTASSSATSAASTGTGATGTFTGDTESDRFGSITVTVTLADGKITNVTYTTTVRDQHSAQIEARAIPTLKARVLAANSAQVSSVSGATYTTDKYLSSLQSALDKAA